MSFGLDKIADRKIAEAVEAGQFDNLEGKGRPLNLDDDPLTPPHLRLANRILRNANVRPDWVQLDVDVRDSRRECEKQWDQIAREYPAWEGRSRRERTPESQRRFAEWHARTRENYLQALKRHNDEILKHNLTAPNSPKVYIPFQIREETQRFDIAFPAPAEAPSPSPPKVKNERRGMLRDSAAALYAAGLRKGPE